MRNMKYPAIAFAVVALVVMAVRGINMGAKVDNQREDSYSHSRDQVMTVALVWPPASDKIEQRYSFAAGARYALNGFTRAGRLKGICQGIRLEEIPEANPQDDSLAGPLNSALADPSLTAILGLASSVDAHRAAILSKGRHVLLLTSQATWPALTKHGFDNLFRLTPDDSASARILSQFARSRGYKKVGIIYSMVRNGIAISPLLAEELAKQKVTVSFLHAYPPNHSPSFTDALGIIGPLLRQDGDVDALFMIDDLDASAAMLTHLRKAGVTVPILSADNLDFPDIWAAAGRAANGACFVSSRSVPKGDGRIPEIYERLVSPDDRKRVTLDKFSHYGFLSGYEAMTMYLSALEASGSFYPRQLGIVLRNREWDSLHGRIRFTSDGDAVGQKLYVNEIVHGQPQVVFTETAVAGDR